MAGDEQPKLGRKRATKQNRGCWMAAIFGGLLLAVFCVYMAIFMFRSLRQEGGVFNPETYKIRRTGG